MARGEYIAIINSDDVFATNRIDRMLTEARASGEREVFAFTDVDFIGPAGEPANEHSRAIAYRDLRAACDALTRDVWFLAGNPAITTSNFFFSRALANEVGAFAPLRYTHDWDWALRAQKRTPPIWIREGLLGYRVHAANTLSEDDVWRHIHENSHVQARALSTLPIESGAEFAAFQTCLALLKNESFHPLPLLFYLLHRLAGVPNSRMEELTAGQGGTWIMRKIAETSACPEGIFHSVRQLAEREQAIVAQDRLIEERFEIIQRMSSEIANRDQVIANRDQVIASQAELIEERWRAMQEMKGMIEARDRCIAAQETLIQERWNAMQEMSRVIVERQEEIMNLRSDRLVKFALRVRKAMRWLRSDRVL